MKTMRASMACAFLFSASLLLASCGGQSDGEGNTQEASDATSIETEDINSTDDLPQQDTTGMGTTDTTTTNR